MNFSRLFAIIFGLMLLAGGIYVQILTQELVQSDEQVSLLQEQLGELRQRLDDRHGREMALQSQLNELDDSNRELARKLSSLTEQLQQAQDRIDPDYVAIEADIRRELMRELEQERSTESHTLLSQLMQLPAEQRNTLMRMQSQFGPYLETLAADEQRQAAIVEAFSAMYAEQRSRRVQLLQETHEQQIDRNRMREEISRTMSNDWQLEFLAPYLYDEEYQLLEQYLAPSPSTMNVFRAVEDANGNLSLSVGRQGSDPGVTPGAAIRYSIITDSGEEFSGQPMILQNPAPQ